MGRPRTSAKILELRGAFDKNPKRRRYERLGMPLCPDPDQAWPAALQDAWRMVLENAPEGMYQQSDRAVLRTLAQLCVLMDEQPMFSRPWFRLEKIVWRRFSQLGITPQARKRLVP